MTDHDDALMAATMTWLRVMLVPPARSRWSWWLRRRPRQPRRSRWRAARRARHDVERALAADPAPRFTEMCAEWQLRPFERDVALLCAAHAMSTEIGGLCAAMPESAGGNPTFALAMSMGLDDGYDRAPAEVRAGMTRVAAEPDWSALAPDRPLRAERLLEVTRAAGQPLVRAAIRMDDRVVAHLLGRGHLDGRLLPLLTTVPQHGNGRFAGESQQERVDAALAVLQRRAAQRRRLLVQMPGGDPATKRLFASWIAGAAGQRLYRLAVAQLDPGIDTAELATLWNRETRLQDVALLVDALDVTPAAEPVLERLLGRLDGLVLLDVREPLPHEDTVLVLDVARPTPAEQRSYWAGMLGAAAADWPERLAAQFDVNIGEMSDAAAITSDDEVPAAEVGPRVWAAYRARGRPGLEGLAQRITTRTRLAQVQLPAAEKELLTEILAQTRHRIGVYDEYGFRPLLDRGLGITALLSGESGTGKTMAAEALANELSLDLYRIDLAGVVSKYIGETEKNLRRIFDAAERGAAVLLFDEADAVFGRRSEVRDSHDRYANIEVSYLLQRMEAYQGLAVLTTNLKQSLDPAFLRRLRFTVAFPFPGPAERELIWRGVFPADEKGAPRLPGVAGLDLALLARPALTGGQIRNIAVNAAFRAAAGDGRIAMPLLAAAARTELRKSGRPFAGADFAAWEPAAVPARGR